MTCQGTAGGRGRAPRTRRRGRSASNATPAPPCRPAGAKGPSHASCRHPHLTTTALRSDAGSSPLPRGAVRRGRRVCSPRAGDEGRPPAVESGRGQLGGGTRGDRTAAGAGEPRRLHRGLEAHCHRSPMTVDRRAFLKTAVQAGALATGAYAAGGCRVLFPSPDVVVIGAGAFGVWTAYYLRRMGAKVTLVDAFGPGNSRATSGDETRGVRTSYGDRPHGQLWMRWANQAITRW